MKNLSVFVCVIALLFASPLLASDKNTDFVCMSEKEASKSKYDINKMRSEYPPMVSISGRNAFPGKRTEVTKFTSPISQKLINIAKQGNGEKNPVVFATLFFSKDGVPLFFFFEGLSSEADRDAFCNVAKEAVFNLQSKIPYSYSFTLQIR